MKCVKHILLGTTILGLFVLGCTENPRDFVPPLAQLNAINDSLVDFHSIFYGSNTVIQYIDIDCSTCIAEVIKLDSIHSDIINAGYILILIASGSFPAVFDYYIDRYPVSFPIFFDRTNEIYLENKLTDDKRFHAIVVNSQQLIIQRGSLIYSDNSRDELIQFLNKKN